MSWDRFFKTEKEDGVPFGVMMNELNEAWRFESPEWTGADVERHLRANDSNTYMFAQQSPGVALQTPGGKREGLLYSIYMHSKVSDASEAAKIGMEKYKTSVEENLARLEHAGFMVGVRANDPYPPAQEAGIEMTWERAVQLGQILHSLGINQE